MKIMEMRRECWSRAPRHAEQHEQFSAKDNGGDKRVGRASTGDEKENIKAKAFFFLNLHE